MVESFNWIALKIYPRFHESWILRLTDSCFLNIKCLNIIKFIRNNLCYIFCLHIVFKLHILKRHEVIFDIIYVII